MSERTTVNTNLFPSLPTHLAYRRDSLSAHFQNQSPPDLSSSSPPPSMFGLSSGAPDPKSSPRIRRPRALTLASATPSNNLNFESCLSATVGSQQQQYLHPPRSPRVLSALPTVPQSPRNVSNLGLMFGFGSGSLSPRAQRNRTVSLTVRTDVPHHGTGPISATAIGSFVNTSNLHNHGPLSARFPMASAFGAPSNHLWTPNSSVPDLASPTVFSSNSNKDVDVFGLMSPRASNGQGLFADEFRARSRALSTTRIVSNSHISASFLDSNASPANSFNYPSTQLEMDYYLNGDAPGYRRIRRMTEGASSASMASSLSSMPAASSTSPVSQSPNLEDVPRDDDVLRTFTYLGLDDADAASQPTLTSPRTGLKVDIPDPAQRSTLTLPLSGSLSARQGSRRAPPPQSLLLTPARDSSLSLSVQSATFPPSISPMMRNFPAPATAGFTPSSSIPGLGNHFATSPTMERARAISLLSAHRPAFSAKEWSGSPMGAQQLISPRPPVPGSSSGWPSYSSNPGPFYPSQVPPTPDANSYGYFEPPSATAFGTYPPSTNPYAQYNTQVADASSVNAINSGYPTPHHHPHNPYPRASVVVQPNPNPVHPTIHGHPQNPTRSLWIGNLDTKAVKSEDLMAVFYPYGAIESCRLLPDKECAFVNFFQLSDAIAARQAMQGCLMGSSHIKIGFGKVAKADQFGAVVAASQVGTSSAFSYAMPDSAVIPSAIPAASAVNHAPMSMSGFNNGTPEYVTDNAMSPGMLHNESKRDSIKDGGKDMNMTDNNSPSRALWIGNLPPSFTVQQLSAMFSPFGQIESCRILTHKNCGFVNYIHEADAVHARRSMHSQDVRGFHIRIGFARVPTSPPKQPSGVDVNTTLLSNINGTFVPGIMPYVNGNANASEREDQFHGPSNNFNHESADSALSAATAGTHAMYPSMYTNQFPDSFVQEASDMNFGPVLGPDEATSPLCYPPSKDSGMEVDESVADEAVVTTHPYLSEEETPIRLDPSYVREIRRKLDFAVTETDVCAVFAGCLPYLDDLVYDYAGNTVLQKLIDRLPVRELEKLAEHLVPNLIKVSVHKHGTWVVQKLMDSLHAVVCSVPALAHALDSEASGSVNVTPPTDEDRQRANEIVQATLNGISLHLPALMCDPFANYMVLNALKLPGAADILFSKSTKYIVPIAQSRTGARALRGCLESAHASCDQKKLVARKLLAHARPLIYDANASILYAWLLDASRLPGRYRSMAEVVVPHLVTVATSRVTAPLILRLVAQTVDNHARELVVKEMFLGLGVGPISGADKSKGLLEHSELPTLDNIVREPQVGQPLVQRVLELVPDPVDRAQYTERVSIATVRVGSNPMPSSVYPGMNNGHGPSMMPPFMPPSNGLPPHYPPMMMHPYMGMHLMPPPGAFGMVGHHPPHMMNYPGMHPYAHYAHGHEHELPFAKN